MRFKEFKIIKEAPGEEIPAKKPVFETVDIVDST